MLVISHCWATTSNQMVLSIKKGKKNEKYEKHLEFPNDSNLLNIRLFRRSLRN